MEYAAQILVMIGLYMMLALSLNLVLGYTGLSAFGHAAFPCVGGYVSALLSIDCGVSPWAGILIGALAATVVGVAIGLTCLRLDGDYLALATFGTVVILNSVAQNWVSLTRGAMGISGIPRICVGGLERKTEFAYVLLIACIVSLTGLGLRWCVASPFGRVLRSIRDDEVAAQALGKDTARYKLIAFSLGAFLAGVAGGLYAHYVSFIGPSTFGVTESLTMVLMVVLGGLGSLRGSLVGAAILVSIPEALRLLGIPSAIAAESKLMLYGLLLIVLMLWRPRGVFGSYGL